MTGNGGFAEKAREVEALVATMENPLIRMTLRILARDYLALAEQDNEMAALPPEANGPRIHKAAM